MVKRHSLQVGHKSSASLGRERNQAKGKAQGKER
jgi:hypothetical protein